MATIHEIASITSKGQLTLPKPIRQVLGVGSGSKVIFEVRGDEVIIRRVSTTADHEDPAIGAFLALLERNIQEGRHIRTLPEDLAQDLLAASLRATDIDEAIEGEVVI